MKYFDSLNKNQNNHYEPMNLSKLRPQKVELLKVNQPDLYSTLKKVFPSTEDAELGVIAGLIIEYVIQSKGNVDIFGDEEI